MENIRIRFGKRLKKLRLERKLTQEELADLADIDYKHIQRFESRNPPAPNLVTLDKLAKALNVPLSRLLELE